MNNRRLLAVDGSLVKEPGPRPAEWRLHYALDLRTLNCHQALVTPVKIGESLIRFSVQEGDIIIADRGFSHRPGITHVLKQGGDVVARMNLCTLPLLTTDGQKFELLPHLRTLEPGET